MRTSRMARCASHVIRAIAGKPNRRRRRSRKPAGRTMPTIQLTNNTGLNVTASSADKFATLNRYLRKPLALIAPGALNAIAQTKVGDVDSTPFPISANLSGEGQFAVEGTSLDVQLGASASVDLLTGADAADFFGALQWTADPAVAAVVSFGLQGT